jgi:hypothetical protein
MRRIRQHSAPCLALLAVALLGSIAPAGDLLDRVTPDTLAYVVVRDLESLDNKAEDLLHRFNVNLPGPLELLQQTTGTPDGLDSHGSLLIGVAAAPTDPSGVYLYAVVPCRNATQFVRSLGGAENKQITAVTLAGEDVLAAPLDQAVILVDATQRIALERMLAQSPADHNWNPAWPIWISENDVSLVVTAIGVQEVVRRSRRNVRPSQPNRSRSGESASEFGADWLWERITQDVSENPQLRRTIAQCQSVALGIRVDELRGPTLRLRLQSRPGVPLAKLAQPVTPVAMPMITLTDQPYVVSAQALIPPAFWREFGAAYLNRAISDLQQENATAFRSDDIPRFTRAVLQSAEQVAAAILLVRSTEGTDAVFSNRFLLVHVDRAEVFSKQVKQSFNIWNEMTQRAEGPLRIHFETEDVQFGNRSGTEYSCDVAKAIGAKDIPGVDSSMQKLFGDDGLALIHLVRYDDQTVLLANANRKQVAALLEELDRGKSSGASPVEQTLGGKMESSSPARLLFDPHHYSLLLNREIEAQVGGDATIFGGPIVRPFPVSTSVEVSLAIESGDFCIEANVPWGTLEGVRDYLRPKE